MNNQSIKKILALVALVMLLTTNTKACGENNSTTPSTCDSGVKLPTTTTTIATLWGSK